MKKSDFKTEGDFQYGDFPLFDYCYNEIVVEDVYGLRELKNRTRNSINTILDLGGNIGIFAIYCRELFPKARIISLEAVKDTYLLLKENTKDHNIESYNMAIGDGSILYLNQCPEHSGANQVKRDPELANQPEIQVQSYTLQNLFEDLEIEGPYAIKMDIEGSELFLYEDSTCHIYLKEAEYIAMEFHRLPEFEIDKPAWDKWLQKTCSDSIIEGLGGNEPGGLYRITRG